jgi:hypothetical protein
MVEQLARSALTMALAVAISLPLTHSVSHFSDSVVCPINGTQVNQRLFNKIHSQTRMKTCRYTYYPRLEKFCRTLYHTVQQKTESTMSLYDLKNELENMMNELEIVKERLENSKRKY